MKEGSIPQQVRIFHKYPSCNCALPISHASHGKGPVDGIGGAVKRHVWSQVKSRKALVTNAESFVAAATGMPKVEALLMPQAEIEARNSDLGLKSVFENAKQIVQIASKHHLKVQNKDVICFTITDDGNSSDERSTPHGDGGPQKMQPAQGLALLV